MTDAAPGNLLCSDEAQGLFTLRPDCVLLGTEESF